MAPPASSSAGCRPTNVLHLPPSKAKHLDVEESEKRFCEKADSGSSNSGANYDTVLPAGWGWRAATTVCSKLFSGGAGIKNLSMLTCRYHSSGWRITAAANVLDFPPRRPCCMQPLPLSRTVRARPPPPRPPREIVPLRQGWRVSPRTHAPFTGPLQNRTYASQPVLNANIIGKFFLSLSLVCGQNSHGVEVL